MTPCAQRGNRRQGLSVLNLRTCPLTVSSAVSQFYLLVETSLCLPPAWISLQPSAPRNLSGTSHTAVCKWSPKFADRHALKATAGDFPQNGDR